MNCGFPRMNCNKKWMIYIPAILSIGASPVASHSSTAEALRSKEQSACLVRYNLERRHFSTEGSMFSIKTNN